MGVVQDLVLISAAVRLKVQLVQCHSLFRKTRGSLLTHECVLVELLNILPCESFSLTA